MSSKSKTLVVIVCLFLLICLLIQPSIATAQETSNWNKQLIDTKATRGNIAIAIDSNNLPHIAYAGYENVCSDSPIDIIYASFNGTEWQKQVVTEGMGKIDLALDSNNNPSIIFNDPIGASLMYAKLTGHNWTVQTVDKSGGSGSLKLDSKGNPHIAYNWLGGELKYASLAGSDWNIQTIDSSRYEMLDFGTSLCLDKNDNPHILYSFTTGQTSNSVSTLKIAYLQNNGWNIQTAASNIDMGYGNLALDSSGNPHFSYSKDHPQSTSGHVTITHESFNGSQWNSDVITNNIMSLDFGSAYLTIENNDTVYASYLTYDYPSINSNLQLAKHIDGQWNTETILHGSDMMNPSPIVMDSKEDLHVAYSDVNSNCSSYNAYLYYATESEQAISVPLETYPSITTIALASALAFVVCMVVGLLLYRRHRKTAILKQ